MSKLDEYRDAQQVIEVLREVKAAIESEINDPGDGGKHLKLQVSGHFEDDSEVRKYGPDNARTQVTFLDTRAESLLADAISHHLPLIIETALGLAGASLMEARAQASLEAAATLTELQPIEELAEGA